MKKLEHVVIPHKALPRLQTSSVSIQVENDPLHLNFTTQCVAALATGSEESVPPPEKYMKIINKYKKVLEPNFKEAKTKHNIEHSIITNLALPKPDHSSLALKRRKKAPKPGRNL